jgi:hypothetical protein
MLDAANFLLMYLVAPIWIAAGFADWFCHLRTNIATSSGIRENLLHWLMYIEIGVGMGAVAALQVNAAVLLIVLMVFLVHELTVYWDLEYSTVLRDVAPGEQMVHSFLEMLPLVSLALLAVVHWPQAQAIFGGGSEMADWTLRLKEQPLPELYLQVGLGATALFNALPLLQETASCLMSMSRPRRRGASPRVEPKLEPDLKARTPATPEPK